MSRVPKVHALVPLLAAAALGLGACGGDGDDAREPRGPSSATLRAELAKATDVDPATFPSAQGKTLDELGREIDGTGPDVGLATSVFPAGKPRIAFGVIDRETGFVYAPTVVYLAKEEGGEAAGPFPAPADLLVTDPPFRSRQAATEKDPFAAVYDAQVDAPEPGSYNVLVVSRIDGNLIGAPTQIRVLDGEKNPIPAVGEKAPAVETDTVASAGGDLASIDTRLPPSDMHETSFKDVVGKKPVVLLFATPQLCQSRVCGPVVDIALQLKAKYGDRVEFIHQEVYVDNEPPQTREPLQEFGLPTEPWLFTFKADGTIAARLEGSFGFRSFEQAIQAAL